MTVVTKIVVKWSFLLGGALILIQEFSYAISPLLPDAGLQEDTINIIAVALIWVAMGIYTSFASWPFKERLLVALGATLMPHLYNVAARNYFGLGLDSTEVIALLIIFSFSILLWLMYSLFWLQVGRIMYNKMVLHKRWKR